ncbi:extracellular solute-binding protein [Nonomuraea sp. PA05]|uniref:ABC transporter substrate-binding protein n=1 Tax=Nonomuraea sp. PA05 TaxID=2604466 RepID=UPI0011D483EA|nr:extracellular solute-binding protein [Nonomuraea sp. PA05]TYB62189.1 extracellular solute-binding protein [Nonomuraea sp. PA05]
MRIRTGAVAALAIVAAMTSLTGCGSAGGSDGKTTITYFAWNNEKTITPLVEAFEQANPDIDIDLSASQAADGYVQTLTTRIAGNQVPDVFHMSTETRTQVMESGLARDLTNEPFMKGLDPTGAALYTLHGKVYGMAPTVWAGVIIYNKKLLKDAGYDTVPATWDEFLAMGKKLAAAKVTPYMEDLSLGSPSFYPLLGGHYAQEGDKKADDAIFTGDKTFEQVWTPLIQQWQRLVTEGVMPKDVVGVNGDQIKQAFMTGQLGMFRSGPWDFADLDSSGVSYGTAPFPALPGGEPFVGGGPDSPYTISAKIDGAKLAAAQKFLAFVNSAEGLRLAEQNMNQISTSAAYTSKVAPQLQDVYDTYIKTGKYYWVNWTKGGTVMAQEAGSQWQLLVQGKATPQSVAQSLDKKWASL